MQIKSKKSFNHWLRQPDYFFFFEKEECTYICPSVNVTINIKNRQNIEVQVVEKSGHDIIFSIGLNSLVGES